MPKYPIEPKRCVDCGDSFEPKSHIQIRCPDCGEVYNKAQARAKQAAYRKSDKYRKWNAAYYNSPKSEEAKRKDRDRWKKPDRRARQKALKQKPSAVAARKRRAQKPESKMRQKEASQRHYAKPEKKAKRRAATKEWRKKNPEKVREHLKKWNGSPEGKAHQKMTQKIRTEMKAQTELTQLIKDMQAIIKERNLSNNTTAIALPDDDKDFSLADIKKMTKEQRLDLLERLLTDVEKKIVLAGMVLISLEEDGYDTSTLRSRPLVRAAKDVYHGKLAKEAFVAYHGVPLVMDKVKSLSLQQQVKLVEQKQIEVTTVVNGETTHSLVKVESLTKEQVAVVFGDGELRTLPQQAQFLHSKAIKETKKKAFITHHDPSGLVDCQGMTGDEIRAYLKKNGL